jgi:hypothetical protein
LGTYCVGTAFLVASFKERLEGQEGEEGDVSSSWMTLMKQEDTGSWRKLRIALFGELSLEEAMDRLLFELESYTQSAGPPSDGASARPKAVTYTQNANTD